MNFQINTEKLQAALGGLSAIQFFGADFLREGYYKSHLNICQLKWHKNTKKTTWPGSLQPLMGSVLSADSSVATGVLLSTCPEEMTQWWWEDTAGGQPGPEDDQQESDNDGSGERFTEHGDTQKDGDGRVDVGDDGGTAGSDLGHEREEGQIGQRGADHAEYQQAHHHLQTRYLTGKSRHSQRQHHNGGNGALQGHYAETG